MNKLSMLIKHEQNFYKNTAVVLGNVIPKDLGRDAACRVRADSIRETRRIMSGGHLKAIYDLKPKRRRLSKMIGEV